MARLIIVLSGCRGAGKNTFANMLAVEWLQRCHDIGGCKNPLVDVSIQGQQLSFDEVRNGVRTAHRIVSLETGVGSETTIESFGFRVHAFATLLKIFLRDTMGISSELLFGTQQDKDKKTHLLWEKLPLGARWRNRRRWYHVLRSGLMSSREAMQVFGTDLMRRWDDDVWVRAAMSYAVNSMQKVVVVADGRFPNEVEYARHCRSLAQHQGSLTERRLFMNQHSLFPELIDSGVIIRTVRLTRRPTKDNHASERAMDNYPVSKFDVVIPPDADLERMREFAAECAKKWFNEADIL